MKKYVVCQAFALALALASPIVVAQQGGANSDWQHKFQVSSTTFTNGGDLPLSMVLGSNNCTTPAAAEISRLRCHGSMLRSARRVSW